MNRFYLSTLIFMLFSANSFTMEQPVIEPIANQEKQAETDTQEEMSCCICLENITENEHYTSLPCNHFLHFDCFSNFAESSGRNKCPLCRHALSDEKLESLKKASSGVCEKITITDHNGVKKTITSVDTINYLKQCKTIKNNDRPGEYDFSQSPEFVNNDIILKLVDYIKNPRTIASQPLDTNKQMLKLADYLEAPQNILFELANTLWPDLQDAEGDTQAVTTEKELLRNIASAHLHCPAKLLSMVRANFAPPQPNNVNFDISHARLVRYYSDCQWLRAEDNLLYNCHHKFCSLKGLKDLLTFLGVQANRTAINLSGHSISNFRLSEIQGNFSKIDLSNNWITTLEAEQFDGNLPLGHRYDHKGLDLTHNKITSINPNMYSLAKQWRLARGGTDIHIDIADNQLSEQQRDDIRNRWRKAVDTLPERIYYKFDSPGLTPLTAASIILGSCLGSSGAGYVINHMLADSSKFVRYPAVAISAISGLLYGGIIAIATARDSADSGVCPALLGAEAGACVGTYCITNALKNVPSSARIPITLATVPATAALGAATFWALSKLPRGSSYTSSLLAKITHPQIKFGDYDAVWRAERPYLYV